MNTVPPVIMEAWPEAMSYRTVARYVDLPGASDPKKAARQGMRFCANAGIAAVRIAGGRYRRVRRADLDKYLRGGK